MNATIIPLARIRRSRPCPDQFARLKELYPAGVPLTLPVARRIQKRGCDVLWGLTHLLTKEKRREFVLFTLRQRQPHLVKLLRNAGLKEHATKIGALKFETFADAKAAAPILNAARAAAWNAARAAAWDEQIRWCVRELQKIARETAKP